MDNDQPTDAQLIGAIAERGKQFDRAASLLFDRYSQKLIAYVCRKGFDTEAARDLLQDILLKFISGIIEKKGNCSVGLLWNIAKTTVIDEIRSLHAKKRDVSTEVSLDEYDSDIPSEDGPQNSEFADCVDKCLDLFAHKWPEHSAALKLALFEEWSMRELSDYLGRTYGATRQYISECRKRLRTLVIEHCAEFVGYANA
jgi:RNA polymerase sigma factor (sigma-70 family)